MNLRADSHLPQSAQPAPAAAARRRLRRGGAAAAAIVLVALFAAAPAWSLSTNVSMVGRGWGHGIGMSQWGAYGYAKHGWTYDKIVAHYYTGIALGKVPNDLIRVRLRGGLASVKLTCAEPFRAAVTGSVFEIPANTVATITWVDSGYKVTAGTASKRFTVPVTFSSKTGLIRTVTADDLGGTGRYRGVMRVVHTTSGFMMINKLTMENYLRGVVPYEMSASWPLEALKAQACAARSYAQRSRNPGEAFDVYCTTRDQVYHALPGDLTANARSDQAVKGTSGVVPTSGGSPISAFYFSASGGHTENIENVWQTSPVSYLKGVDDPYDTYATYHVWPENPIVHGTAWYMDKLGGYSDKNPTGVKGGLRTIYVVKRGVSPRVVKAALVGANGVTWVSGASLRYKLLLRDTWVSFRSVSIEAVPATVVYAKSASLKARTYPGLANGTTVTLHVYRAGAWTTRSVATVSHTQDLGSGYSASYSTVAVTVTPKKPSTYYVTYGTGRSPKVKVNVAPAVTAAASATSVSAGGKVTVSGGVLPLLPGAKVVLQTKSGTTWSDAANGTLTSEGKFSFDWTASAGVVALRVRVPATSGYVAGVSPAIAVTVSS